MIAFLIIVAAGAFASGWMSRYLVERSGRPLPAATRRAIRRDRRRQRLGLADIRRPARREDHVVSPQCGETIRDPLHGRLTDAIAKLGADPAPDWQAGVWDRARGSRRRGAP